MINKDDLYAQRLPRHLMVYTLIGLTIAMVSAFLSIKIKCNADKIEKAYDQENIKLIQTCAHHGVSNAKVALGRFHLYGYGNLISRNYKKALKLCKPEAENGNANGMFCMGLIYGSTPEIYDVEQMLLWKKRAAEQNHGEAIAHIGLHHLTTDNIKSKEWFNKSLPFINSNYMQIIGNIYRKSYFIEDNLFEAKIWYQRAYDAGNTDVVEYLKPDPAPFDLELTKATVDNFKQRFPQHQFKFISAITEGEAYEVESKYIDLEGIADDKVKFLFNKNNTLEYVSIIFSKNQFNKLRQTLNQKYKIFDSSGSAPFDRYIIYNSGMSIIDLQEPHLSFKMTLSYYTARFDEALKEYTKQQKNKDIQKQQDSL